MLNKCTKSISDMESQSLQSAIFLDKVVGTVLSLSEFVQSCASGKISAHVPIQNLPELIIFSALVLSSIQVKMESTDRDKELVPNLR